MAVLMGHLPLRNHLHKLGKVQSTECRECTEDDKTLEHCFSEFPAFSRLGDRMFHASPGPNLTEMGSHGWVIEPVKFGQGAQ